MKSKFYDKLCTPSKTITGILNCIHKICHKETNIHFITYYLRSHFNTAIDNWTKTNINVNDSIPIFFSIDSNFSVTIESSFDKCSIIISNNEEISFKPTDKIEQNIEKIMRYHLAKPINYFV